jgi:hypothetical protein
MHMLVPLGVLFLPWLLWAQDEAKSPVVRLISESRSIPRGKVIFMGIHLINPPRASTIFFQTFDPIQGFLIAIR